MPKAKPFLISRINSTTSPTRPTNPSTPTAPTLGQSMKDGFGLGVGVSIADRLVSSVFGPRQVQMVPVPIIETKKELTTYERCLELTLGREDPCAHLKESKST